jgi:alanyl-tRNA synthetase
MVDFQRLLAVVALRVCHCQIIIQHLALVGMVVIIQTERLGNQVARVVFMAEVEAVEALQITLSQAEQVEQVAMVLS